MWLLHDSNCITLIHCYTLFLAPRMFTLCRHVVSSQALTTVKVVDTANLVTASNTSLAAAACLLVDEVIPCQVPL